MKEDRARPSSTGTTPTSTHWQPPTARSPRPAVRRRSRSTWPRSPRASPPTSGSRPSGRPRSRLPALLPLSRTGLGADQGGRRGQGRGHRAAPGGDAPASHLGRRRARSGSRSSTPSAWARTSPPSCTWPTTTSCSSPAGSGPRPPHIEQRLADLDGPHGERDPEVPAQRVRDDRGVQRPGRRGRRAVPRPGRRQLPGQLQRGGGPPAGQHRQQRRAVRRLHADLASTPSSRSRSGMPAQGPGAALRQPDLAGRPAPAGATATSAGSRSTLDAPPEPRPSPG